ncbi:MAG: hypothetical protein ACI9DC_004782 [Gammaproteobacteria bacterium]|jgi:hypothetical protein
MSECLFFISRSGCRAGALTKVGERAGQGNGAISTASV